MPRRLKSTLRSVWWVNYFKTIRHCFSCGGALNRRYVKQEKTWRLVCDKCGQITYLNPKVVAGLVPVMPDGRVVLLRRDIEPALGRWTYPAGFQELGESVEAAAIRETKEEICVNVRRATPLGIYSYPDAGVVTVVYSARVPRGEVPKPGQESQNVHLFRPQDIPWRDLAFRSTTDALRDWLKKK